jgi:hypothetical protein
MASSQVAIRFVLPTHDHDPAVAVIAADESTVGEWTMKELPTLPGPALLLMTLVLIAGLLGARERDAHIACVPITVSGLFAMSGFGQVPGDIGRGNRA